MIEKYGIKIDGVWSFYDLLFTSDEKPKQGSHYTFANSPLGNNHPGHDRLLADGWRLLVPTEYNQATHKLVVGSYSAVDAETMQQDTVALSTDEITANLAILRKSIRKDIRKTANFYLDQITAEYSNTRMTRFQKYLDEINAGNGTYFKRMAGASDLTGSQFMISYVKPMIVAGDRFVDEIIGIETTLLEELKVVADRDLRLFDYKTMWDDVDDFVDPPPDNVDPTWWAALKAKLQMKVW